MYLHWFSPSMSTIGSLQDELGSTVASTHSLSFGQPAEIEQHPAAIAASKKSTLHLSDLASVEWTTDPDMFARGTCTYATHANGGNMVLNHVPDSDTVAVAVMVHAGARNERIEEAGIAHVIEHIAFLTPDGGQSPIWYKNDCGRISNAVTTKDATRFYTLTQPEQAESVFGMILNNTHPDTLMSHSTEVIQNEVRAVLDEKHMRGGGFTDMYYAMQMHVSNGWPVIGYEESLRNITKKSVERFVRQHYKPERVTLFVCGNLKEDLQLQQRFKKQMHNHFNSWPQFADTVADPLRSRMSQTSDLSFLHSTEDDTSYGYGYRAPGTRTADTYKDAVTMEVISNMLSMHRISNHLGIGMTPVFERMYDPSAFLVVSGATPAAQQNILQDVQQVGEAVHKRMNDYVGSFGQPYVLDTVKKQILYKHVRSTQTNMGMVDAVADSVGRGAWNEFSTFLHTIDSLTVKDIRDVAHTWWKEGPVAQLIHSPMVAPSTVEDTHIAERPQAVTKPQTFALRGDYRDVTIHGSADVEHLGIWKHVVAKNIEDTLKPLCEDECIDMDVSVDGSKMCISAAVPYAGLGTAGAFLTTAVRGAIVPPSVIKGLQQHCYDQLRTMRRVRTSGSAMLRRHIFADKPEHKSYFMTPDEVSVKSNGVIPAQQPVRFHWSAHGVDDDDKASLESQLVTHAQPPADVLAPLRVDATLRQQLEANANKADHVPSFGIGQLQAQTPSTVSMRGPLNFVGVYDMPFSSFCIAGGVHVDGVAKNSRDHLCLGIATRCLGSGFRGRLMNLLRSQHHLTYGVGASFDAEDEMWSFSLTVAKEDVEQAREDVAHVLTEWLQNPCDSKDIEDQRRIWKGQIANTLDEPQMQTRDSHRGNVLAERANRLEQLQTSPEEIKQVVARNVRPSHIKVVLCGPLQAQQAMNAMNAKNG